MPDDHTLIREALLTSKNPNAKVALERLVRERDKARGLAAMADDVALEAVQRAEKAERERDEAQILAAELDETLRKVEWQRNEVREALREIVDRYRPDDLAWAIATTALAGSTAPERPEGREGIVTVYDHNDRYLGCMGIETWRKALADSVPVAPKGSEIDFTNLA